MTRRKKSNFMSFLWHISVFERQFPIVNWVSSSHRLCCMGCSSKRATTRSVCENWLRRLFVFRSPFDVFMQCSVHSLMCVIFKHSLHRQNVSLKAKCYFITIPSTWAYDKITVYNTQPVDQYSMNFRSEYMLFSGKGKAFDGKITWKQIDREKMVNDEDETFHKYRERERKYGCIVYLSALLPCISSHSSKCQHYISFSCQGAEATMEIGDIT